MTALIDAIAKLRDESRSAFDGTYDYFEHSKTAFDMVKEQVAAGFLFDYRAKATGSVVDQTKFVELGNQYHSTIVINSVFQQCVSHFEDFFFDLLRLWLTAYPGSLAEQTLKFDIVLKAADKDSIASAVIDARLNQVKYERVADWFRYLEKLTNIGVSNPAVIDLLAEIKASRDIVVHNKSIANKVYEAKAGKLARCPAGERLEIPEPYLRQAWTTIKDVIKELADAAITKLPSQVP